MSPDTCRILFVQCALFFLHCLPSFFLVLLTCTLHDTAEQNPSRWCILLFEYEAFDLFHPRMVVFFWPGATANIFCCVLLLHLPLRVRSSTNIYESLLW